MNIDASENDGLRLFGRSQRIALYAASGGCCECCGELLNASFHADHIVPYISGGATDINNGAALCPFCNAKKGARSDNALEALLGRVGIETVVAEQLLPQTPLLLQTPLLSLPPLRNWQACGLETYQALRNTGQTSILASACPGAGKMIFGCLAILEEFKRGADCVIVLVPTQALKQQWAKAAAEWGITLTANWPGTAMTLPADVHGAVLSYGQIAGLPDGLRLFCARKSAVVILDELHHLGRSLKWGEAVFHAAEFAQARLCLTGTAWRSDGLPIPFIASDDSGIVLADIRYSYRQALADGIVRPAFFFAFGGQFEWASSGGSQLASFDNPLGEVGQSCRLRAALDPKGGWMKSVLTQAAAALQAMRETHPRAKGLITCMDAAHAREVAGLATEILGERPALALFDDPKAAAVLAQFRSDDAPLLIACRMGTEGYDAPDLRLLVWASHITSELYFWQTVGRLLRTVSSLRYQDAVIFMPADQRLMAMAARFADEPSVSLRKGQELVEGKRRLAALDTPRARSVTLHSEALEPLIVTAGGIISAKRLSEARFLKASRPHLSHLPDHHVAAELAQIEAGEREFEDLSWEDGIREASTVCEADMGGAPGINFLNQGGDVAGSSRKTGLLPRGAPDLYRVVPDLYRVVPDLYDEQRARLRHECNQLAQRIAQELGLTSGRVHQILGRRLGFRQADATIAQLQTKVDLLRQRVLGLGTTDENLGASGEPSP